MDTAAFNIYAKQLISKKHGYALWLPEPTKFGEVHIGDVGYFRDGGFYKLFNATVPEDAQQKWGVPEGYTPFRISEYLLNETRNVIPVSLVSNSVTSYDVGGGVATSLQVVGGELKFSCKQEQGAFVFVQPAADRRQMHPSKSLIRYIRSHIDDWYHFATDVKDVDISREDISFVSGVIKTADWGLGAFLRQGSGGEVSFQTNLGSFAQGSFTFSRSRKAEGVAEWRTKPEEASNSPVSSSASVAETLVEPGSSLTLKRTQTGPKKDQCIFLSYYKMKRRLWRNRVVKAAAGDDERDSEFDSDGDEDIANESDDLEGPFEEPATETPFDPVNYLLDYILDYKLEDGSQVDTAVAGIDHLYALFDDEFPDDIPAALEKLRPPILFIEDGVAALACAEWAEELDDNNKGISGADQVARKDPPLDASISGDADNFGGDHPSDPSTSASEDNPSGKARAAGTYQVVTLTEHTGGTTCAAWSPDGRYILTASEDHTIALRDGTSGELIQMLTEHPECIWSVKFSPDGKKFASIGNEASAFIWDVEAREISARLVGHTGTVDSVDFSPDGAKVVTASVDGSVCVWDVATGARLHDWRHASVAMHATFSPNGIYVASCSSDSQALIHDAETGALLHTLTEHSGLIWTIAFDSASERVVTASDDATAIVWKVDTGEALIFLSQHSGPVWAASFSPNGKWVLTASNDGTVKLWDSWTGEAARTWELNDPVTQCVVFSPDSKYVAAGGGDHDVLVWNAATGESLPRMRGHTDKIMHLVFSPTSDKILSCSDDGTVRLWTLPEGY
ncbi:WD40-repeat-containing domain protein [Trametes polyzona]|nr:WD40-repeat-containing domain protein [Trametes polyzona]